MLVYVFVYVTLSASVFKVYVIMSLNVCMCSKCNPWSVWSGSNDRKYILMSVWPVLCLQEV